MPRINLLPWREELREQRRNQFYAAMAGAVGAAAAAVFLGVLVMNSVISHQLSRNQVLKEEMSLLDRKIEEIKDLESKKDRLVARMQIIEQLQQSRPEVVHLFEELVRTLPDGVYLTEVKQSGTSLSIEGAAESNTRVSAFMRNIDKSGWLTGPDLEIVEVIKGDRAPGALGSRFSIRASQIVVAAPGEDAS
jgi:type IV pilus assembly protein PilN